MKHLPRSIMLLIILGLACFAGGLTGCGNGATPQSEHRGGEGVCDGPEDAKNCPQDCGGAFPGSEDRQDEAPAGEIPAGEPFQGMVISSVHLLRDVGNGDCGIEPWRGEGCSSSVYWWGLELQAAANTPVLVMPDGEIRVYFVTLCPEEVRNQIVVAVSRDAVNWTYRKTSITGMTDIQPIAVDPTVEFTPDGRIRLYFTSAAASPSASPQSYSAISDDGITFEMEPGARFGVEGSPVLDPTALRVGDTWRYFGGGQPGINYHAASPDGLTFTRQDDLKVNGFLFANGIAVEGGYRYYGFIQQPHSAASAIYSVFTTDGQTWLLEDGVRLALDEASPLEKIGVKDPGVAQLADGRFLMVYSTLIPEYPYDEP